MNIKSNDLAITVELIKKCYNQNNFDDAIDLCEAIIKVAPKNADALYLLGLVNYRTGQPLTAITLINEALENDSTRAEFHCTLGEILETLGSIKEAEASYRKSLIIDRKMVKPAVKLGIILINRGQSELGIKALEKSLRLEPKNIDAIIALATAKSASGRIVDALELTLSATTIAPLFETIWNNLGSIHILLEQWKNALNALKKSLVLAPQNSGPLSNIGFVYLSYGDFKLAKRYFNFSLIIRPDVGNAFCGLAETAFIENDLEKALHYSKIAIELEPTHYHYQSRRALQLLAAGRFCDGWIMRDSRLMLRDKIDHRHRPPRWDGSPLTGKTILITAEEGIGDELFFASCFNDIIADCKICFIECDQRLVKLYQRSFPTAIIGATERTGNRFKPVQSYNWLPTKPIIDFSIEAGSLFRYYRSNWKSFSGKSSYLLANNSLKQYWKTRLNKQGTGLKIGFCWRSKSQTGFRNHHYAQLQDWISIFQTPDCSFFSLQYGTDWKEEIEQLPKDVYKRITVLEDADLSNDFETISAIVSCMDLIICPSSTVSWIGGGLGIPTWVAHLNPNWTQLGTEKFPGFPTMKSFSKNITEPWDTVFKTIKEKLNAIRIKKPEPSLHQEK